MTINEKKSKADLTLKELDIIAFYRSLSSAVRNQCFNNNYTQ